MSDIITGARASLWVGAKKLGYATSVSVSRQIQQEAFEPLDTIEVQEYVAVGIRYRIECGFVRFLDKPATALGLLASPETYKAGNPEITMKIMDSVSKKTLFTAVGCAPESDSTQISARGMATFNMGFVCRSLIDETSKVNATA